MIRDGNFLEVNFAIHKQKEGWGKSGEWQQSEKEKMN